ncbi:hypothetical protein VPH35_030070 [Triticum aestivum]
MWMYSGTEDTTRIHPEEIDGATLEQWMGSITGNKDKPQGARRVVPLDQSYEVDKATTKMYSMPNGAQEQAEEGEASGGESEEEEWKSDDERQEDQDGSSKEEEEMEVDPPCTERRSKLAHDPARERSKAVAPFAPSIKRPRTASPAPTEKATKHPRAERSKPPKALPKMKVAIPTISG